MTLAIVLVTTSSGGRFRDATVVIQLFYMRCFTKFMLTIVLFLIDKLLAVWNYTLFVLLKSLHLLLAAIIFTFIKSRC